MTYSEPTRRQASGIGTFILGIIGLAVFATLVVWWIKAYTPLANSADQERASLRLAKRQELEKDWSAKLGHAAWVDKDKGMVQLPIDDAIRVVAGELKAKKVAKSDVKVPAPLPVPVADPKATEPPLPLLPSAPQGANLINFAVAPTAPGDAANEAGSAKTNGAKASAPVSEATTSPAVPPASPASSQTIPPPSTLSSPGGLPPASPQPAPTSSAVPAQVPDVTAPASPAKEPVPASGLPARPPLINWNESK